MPTPSAAATLRPSPSPSPAPTKTAAPPASPSPAATKALWGIVGSNVVEFTSSQIGSGTVNPIHQFSIANSAYMLYQALAFDAAGNLWIAEGGSTSGATLIGRVVEYGAAELTALSAQPNPQPLVTLTLSSEAEGLAFDQAGNLWVSIFSASAGGEIEKFSAAQIASGGSPSPAVSLVPGGDGGALTFGSDGTLWYVPMNLYGPSDGRIVGLAPSQLASSGSPTPAYALNVPGDNAIGGQEVLSDPPDQVAFDGSGNLWSVFNGQYFEFAATSLHASNSSPSISIQAYPVQQQGGDTAIDYGYALAFDSANDLIGALVSNSAASLVEYTPAQYQSSSPVPQSAAYGSSVTFSPAQNGNFIATGPYVP